MTIQIVRNLGNDKMCNIGTFLFTDMMILDFSQLVSEGFFLFGINLFKIFQNHVNLRFMNSGGEIDFIELLKNQIEVLSGSIWVPIFSGDIESEN